jgi:hypothetical protein
MQIQPKNSSHRYYKKTLLDRLNVNNNRMQTKRTIRFMLVSSAMCAIRRYVEFVSNALHAQTMIYAPNVNKLAIIKSMQCCASPIRTIDHGV